MNFVDFRNLALGDKNIFEVEDSNLFYVAEIAEGTQGIRRQRIEGYSTQELPTSLKAVKIYEELNRILAGRVDFNYMINKATESMQKRLLDDIYSVWVNATATDFGGAVYFPTAGTYSEDALLELIAHVEAAAGGRTATILGTKTALRKLAPSISSIDAGNDMYHNGVYGSFYGSPVQVLPQRHKVNSTTFLLPDDTLTIVANGDEKPIKVVYEGDSLIIPGEPLMNGDLTQEWLYAERYGVGIILAGGNAGVGRYQFT